ncbi:H/ACA RNA-protein complex component Gar1 [Salinarchaeum sp. Harcht-Bsk1]|uniref:H/ACA ribonucleoprotein complex subunit GAR1 n=1 Tax=Salinarchaeum sp. Harcht-Bsk1 TaxID=1333523 RepID=UPI0003424639|nr:Gar1/Naf1 family protein [Salinarchaeum sp. Harcht-Bsk1]AGN02853.1 H/ACA RNA-protein complex component Gar1 [Salinarchaeum sp. Harcht-Bsk1]
MERLGTTHRIAQGLAIVKVDDVPDIGTEVVDDQLDEVGSVVDVFGPVSEPYAAVSPRSDRSLAPLIGQPLYLR